MDIRITDDVRYIGVDDHEIDLFEGQFEVPGGMAYNSYVILDDKVAVMDTVDARFGTDWLAKLDVELGGRTPDYLVVHHVEPDHSANITAFTDKYPSSVVVSSQQAFKLIANLYGTDFADRRLVVGDGAELELG
ncbi:MAG: FprA family A-type flavoprotein, partial [Oscillospiraceae bacterium]|nr:FprA family A-type flavoprotein [Oscillospiraceae bacterium]